MEFVDGIHKLKHAMHYQNVIKLLKSPFVESTTMHAIGITKLIVALPSLVLWLQIKKIVHILINMSISISKSKCVYGILLVKMQHPQN